MLRAAYAVAVLLAAACGGSNGVSPPVAAVGALATPHPLTVQVTTAASRSVSATIGAAGGQVTATAANGATLTLEIPAGALLSTHTITLTPIASIAGFPLRGGMLAGAQLGPDGLLMAKAARLTVNLAAGPRGGMKAYGFGYRRAGAELHLVKASGIGTSLSLTVWHFSGAGVGAGTSSDAGAQGANTPAAPEDQVEQAQALGQPVIPLLLGWDAELAAQIGQRPDLPQLDLIYQQTLIFESFVTSAGRADLARDIYSRIGLVLQVAAQLALGNCRSTPDAVEGLRVIRWIEWAQGHPQVLSALDVPALEQGVLRCLRFKLDFTTHLDFSFAPEAMHLVVEARSVAIDAVSAIPLKFGAGVGELKYDSYVWSVPGVQYTMSLTIDREFTVTDVSMDLDGFDSAGASAVVDGMSVTVDFGDTTETARVIAPFPVPPLPFKSFYANGMENMHRSASVGPHLYAIRGWTAGSEPEFAMLHETCPCEQVSAAGGFLNESQDTLWVIRHAPE